MHHLYLDFLIGKTHIVYTSKPISLVECVYKDIVKVLANKIKLILPKIIDNS